MSMLPTTRSTARGNAIAVLVHFMPQQVFDIKMAGEDANMNIGNYRVSRFLALLSVCVFFTCIQLGHYHGTELQRCDSA